MVTELINNTSDQFSTTFMCGQARESELLYESEEDGKWNNQQLLLYQSSRYTPTGRKDN